MARVENRLFRHYLDLASFTRAIEDLLDDVVSWHLELATADGAGTGPTLEHFALTLRALDELAAVVDEALTSEVELVHQVTSASYARIGAVMRAKRGRRAGGTRRNGLSRQALQQRTQRAGSPAAGLKQLAERTAAIVAAGEVTLERARGELTAGWSLVKLPSTAIDRANEVIEDDSDGESQGVYVLGPGGRRIPVEEHDRTFRSLGDTD